MSKHALRHEKTCLNCGHEVEVRFCSNCGQENTETKHSFFYIYKHFVADFFHFEGNFWTTIKHAFSIPGKPTQAYLQGQRKKYFDPVKMYIFISFFVFFAGAIILHKTEKYEQKKFNTQAAYVEDYDTSHDNFIVDWVNSYTFQQFDSLYNTAPNFMERNAYHLGKNTKLLLQKYSFEQLGEMFEKQLVSNFPKLLFLYMPVFCFWLWLFGNKKKWWYFDHAIFTINFFSLVLLIMFVGASIIQPLSILFFKDYQLYSEFGSVVDIVSLGLTILFFILSYSRVYEKPLVRSIFSAIPIFIFNFIAIVFTVLIYLVYTVFSVVELAI